MNDIIDFHTHHNSASAALIAVDPRQFYPQQGLCYSVGFHPWNEVDSLNAEDFGRLAECALHPQVLAVGETAAFPRLPVRLTLFACVTKGSRWDWTIEKAVELGATQIIPVLSARCIVRLTTAERAAKAERWRRIAADAARQSDAVWLPEVREAVEFAEAVELAKGHGRVFAGALTDPPPPPIWREVAAALQENCRALGVFVGPEGDFTPEELHALLEVAKPVSFGPTILRDETAAIFGLSVLAAAIQSCPTVATESSLTGL